VTSYQLEDEPNRLPASLSLRRSVGILVAGDLVNRGLRLVATVILAHVLTLKDFGLLNVGIAASGLAVTATTLGLPDLGARDTALHPDRVAWLAGRILAARVTALLILASVALIVTALLLPDQVDLALPAAVMAIFMTSSADWLARGLERMTGLARAWILGGLTIACGAGVVAIASGNAVGALWCFAAAEAASAAGCWIAVRHSGRPQPSFRGLGGLVRRSWPLWISTVVIYSYYANIDTILLAAVHSNTEAGLYSAPYRTFLVLNVVGVFAAYALLPRLSRQQSATDESGPPPQLLAVLWTLLAYGAIVVGAAALVGEAALSLIFGDAFGAAAPTFILLCTAVAWYSVGYPAGYSLIAIDRNRRFLLGALVAGALNLGLNALLIPPFGIEGAGVATVGAFSAAALVWLWVREINRASLLRIGGSLGVVTLAGALCAASEELRASVGSFTLAVGLLAAMWFAHRSGLSVPRPRASSR
jgi:O-antigen/teichoic acid export membrane protein